MGRFGDRNIGRFGDRDVVWVHVAILGPFLDDMIRIFGSIFAYKMNGATTRPRQLVKRVDKPFHLIRPRKKSFKK